MELQRLVRCVVPFDPKRNIEQRLEVSRRKEVVQLGELSLKELEGLLGFYCVTQRLSTNPNLEARNST